MSQEVDGSLHPCTEHALHATDEPHRWCGSRVWVVALVGQVVADEQKCCALRREIIGEVLPEHAWGESCGARLGRLDLAGANLAGANLVGANLVSANLVGADLTGANLTRANLTGANLADAHLTRVNLAGANLAGADLAGADFAGANLAGAYYPTSYLPVGWQRTKSRHLERSSGS
jgi:hypothetical protein